MGFKSKGHAGFADSGYDIICAGVSALVINTINSIDQFTKEAHATNQDQETGLISFRFEKPAGHDAELLMKSMVLGVQEIQHN